MEPTENKTIILMQRPEDIDVTLIAELPVPDENGNRITGCPIQLERMIFVKRENGKVEFSAIVPESAAGITAFTGSIPMQHAMMYPGWHKIEERLIKHGKTFSSFVPMVNLLVYANDEKYLMDAVIIPDSKSREVWLYSINAVPMEEVVKPNAQ